MLAKVRAWRGMGLAPGRRWGWEQAKAQVGLGAALCGISSQGAHTGMRAGNWALGL